MQKWLLKAAVFFDVLSVLFHVTYNKENELKPIKKLHERAIFYYVVMPVPIETLLMKITTATPNGNSVTTIYDTPFIQFSLS